MGGRRYFLYTGIRPPHPPTPKKTVKFQSCSAIKFHILIVVRIYLWFYVIPQNTNSYQDGTKGNILTFKQLFYKRYLCGWKPDSLLFLIIFGCWILICLKWFMFLLRNEKMNTSNINCKLQFWWIIFNRNINKTIIFVNIHSNILLYVVTNPLSTYTRANNFFLMFFFKYQKQVFSFRHPRILLVFLSSFFFPGKTGGLLSKLKKKWMVKT